MSNKGVAMKKFPKIIIAASLLLILCILILYSVFQNIRTKEDLNTLNILAPTWVSEKFKLSEAASQFIVENSGVKVIVERSNNYDSSYYPLMNKSLQNKYDIVLGGSREHIVLFAASDTIINFDNGFFDEPHSRWTEISEVLGEENVGILPLPNAEKNGSLTYIHGITIPSNSPNKELAFQFIKKKLLTRGFQAWTMEKYGKIPSLIRNYEVSLSPEWNSILSWVRNASTLPIYKDWPKIDKVLQIEI